jgi:hypothetical protein
MASAALLAPADAGAAPGPEQAVQVVADSAADDYRAERRTILLRYRSATEQARDALQQALGRAGTQPERTAAWEDYRQATALASTHGAHELKQARTRFRAAVDQARDWAAGQG